MMAKLRVRGHRGVFVADHCEVTAGLVNASGRWRERRARTTGTSSGVNTGR